MRTMIAKATEGVRAILSQGGNPAKYRSGLADHYGVTGRKLGSAPTDRREGREMRYEISEESGASEIIEAGSLDSALDDAREWASEGVYDERVMVRVYAQRVDEDGDPVGPQVSGEVEAGPEVEAPECIEDADHDWQSPEWLGGCRENPGVWSHGGTRITIRMACARCGAYRVEERTGSQRDPGELAETISYEGADETSLGWARE